MQELSINLNRQTGFEYHQVINQNKQKPSVVNSVYVETNKKIKRTSLDDFRKIVISMPLKPRNAC